MVCWRKRSATVGETPTTTCALIPGDVAEPGFGLVTVICTVPACAVVAVPAAVSCVLDTKVVVSADEPMDAVAPLTKPLPVIVMLKEPTSMKVGETDVTTGRGFNSVATVLALTESLVESAASTVTVLGFGSTAGAV